jgi:transmembrane 9 superfamily protein 2/4
MTGWKLVHGYVFRPPVRAELLCMYVGMGVQFFGMLLVTLIFAFLGLLSLSNWEMLMMAMLLAWVFMALLAGYSSARLYKVFNGPKWKKVTIKTATMFPQDRVRHLLCPERAHLGREVVRYRAVHHHVCAGASLVRHLL